MLAHFCRARGRAVVFIGIIRCGPCSPLISPGIYLATASGQRVGSDRAGPDGMATESEAANESVG